MLENLFDVILKNTIVASIFIIIFLILKKYLVTKYSAKFNYYIWLTIVFKMILPLSIPVYFKASTTLNTENSISQLIVFGQNKVSELSYLYNDIFSFISIVWILGAINLLIYNNISYIKIKRNLLKNSYKISNNRIETIFKDQLTKLKINKRISLRSSEDVHSPLGIGIFKKCIYLPVKDFSDNELILILRHELIHFKRYDLIYKYLILIVKSIYWFNPFVYKLDKLVAFDCELSCDELVLKNSNMDIRKDYAKILVSSIRFNNKIKRNQLITNFNNNNIKRRIDNMLNINNKKNGLIFVALVLTVIGGSMFSFKAFADTPADHINDKNKVDQELVDMLENEVKEGSATKYIDKNGVANYIKSGTIDDSDIEFK